MHGAPCHLCSIQYMSQPCAETLFGLSHGSCYSTMQLDCSSSLILCLLPLECQGGASVVVWWNNLVQDNKNPLLSFHPGPVPLGGLIKILPWHSSNISARAAPPCVHTMYVQHWPPVFNFTVSMWWWKRQQKYWRTYLFKDRFLNPKSLKLNGLVLGEEVGSDCQDEIPQDLYDA